MALTVRSVEYFYANVANESDKAYALLTQLAEEEITLLAFSAVPFGDRTADRNMELTLFPDSTDSLLKAAAKFGWTLRGPQHAVLIQGDDHLTALADIHSCLNEAGVKIFASTGVTDGAGRFGYIIYFSEGDHVEAERALAAALIKK